MHDLPRPPRPARRRHPAGRFLWTVPRVRRSAATPAHADACADCAAPGLELLQQQPGFELAHRPWSLLDGELVRDYYEVDAGECTAELNGPPHVTRLHSWLVLRGRGEVWNCPHSRSSDVLTVEAAREDSTAWELTASAGLKLGDMASAVTGEIQAGRSTGVAIQEVTRIAKTIHASWCHRIPWWGFFEVSAFQARASFSVKRRFAWWTKSVATGATVHAQGDVWVDCGSASLELGRHAPVAGFFALSQRGCADERCRSVVPKQLGFFPPLPPHLPEPTEEGPTTAPPVTTAEPGQDEPTPATGGPGDAPGGALPDPLAGEPGR